MFLLKLNSKAFSLFTQLFFMQLCSYAQFNLGMQQNADLFKPYTEDASYYISINENVKSFTSAAYLSYSLAINDKSAFQFGLNHKLINHQVLGRIKKVEVIKHDSFGNPTDTTYFAINGDLITVSNSYGFSLGYSYDILSHTKWSGKVGILTEVYLYEKSRSFYEYEESKLDEINNWSNDYAVALPRYSAFSNFNRFFLSSINFSTYYKHVWQLHENFSLAARVSVGTNLYSEWDQFRKYVWMGVGLEMGFGSGRRLGVAGNQ
jgi:hypothetical protein